MVAPGLLYMYIFVEKIPKIGTGKGCKRFYKCTTVEKIKTGASTIRTSLYHATS
jgi:hypothetical protein